MVSVIVYEYGMLNSTLVKTRLILLILSVSPDFVTIIEKLFE